MKHVLPGVFLSLFLFLAATVALVPGEAAAQTGIVPCGRNTGTADEMKPCTACHVILGGQRLINWGTGIMTVIALTVILAMGVLYIVSAGNQGLMQQAKGGLLAALVGFAIMLSAWLIVNIVLTVLVDTGKGAFPELTSAPGVFTFTCDRGSNVNVGP